MRGVSAVITTLLLLLLAIAASTMFFGYLNRLRTDIVSEGESQLIELEIPPKLISLICYENYGYMLLSLSQGQGTVSGNVYYTVGLDTGQIVKEGFVDVTLQDSTEVYVPYLFDADERYQVTLGAKGWKLSDYCNPISDPHMALYIPFDEGSGTTAGDFAGGNNGTLTGYSDGTITDAVWTTGHSGTALNFDGAGDHVEIPDDVSLEVTDEITISAWIKLAELDGNLHGIVAYSDFELRAYKLAWDNRSGTNRLWFSVNNGTTPPYNTLSPTVNLQEDQWYHIVATYNSTEMRIFVDSVSVGSKVPTSYLGGYGSYSVDIGSWTTYWFNGTIDEVRIYDRSLTASEIQQLYQGMDVRRDLVGYWSFDEGSGSTAYDTHMWTTGKRGGAIYVDGSNDYVEFESSEVFNITDEITLLAWVNPSNYTEKTYAGIVFKANTVEAQGGCGTNYALTTYYWDPKPDFFVTTTGGSTCQHKAGNTDMEIGGWYFIAGTYDSGTGQVKAYLDGTPDGSGTYDGEITNSPYPIRVGRGLHYFNGIIDEVFIYSRAMSDEEIQIIYQAYVGDA